MSLLDAMRKQWAVYWALSGDKDLHGHDQYEDPIEIKVRWEDREERDVTPLTGEEFIVKSTVYVGQDVTLGGVLWLGLLVDAPSTPPEHNKIKVFRRIPKKNGKKFLRIARL